MLCNLMVFQPKTKKCACSSSTLVTLGNHVLKSSISASQSQRTSASIHKPRYAQDKLTLSKHNSLGLRQNCHSLLNLALHRVHRKPMVNAVFGKQAGQLAQVCNAIGCHSRLTCSYRLQQVSYNLLAQIACNLYSST